MLAYPTMEDALTLTPEEVERHTHTALTLDEKVENRRFWLSFDVDDVERGAERDVAGALAGQVDAWLETLDDSNAGEVTEREFDLGGWRFTIRVAPKGQRVRERGGTIIANPYPAFAYWVNG